MKSSYLFFMVDNLGAIWSWRDTNNLKTTGGGAEKRSPQFSRNGGVCIKKKSIIVFEVFMAVAVVSISAVLFVVPALEVRKQCEGIYERAETLLKYGNYQAAYDAWMGIYDYADSKDRADNIYPYVLYQQGVKAFGSREYFAAMQKFAEIDGFMGSHSYLLQSMKRYVDQELEKGSLPGDKKPAMDPGEKNENELIQNALLKEATRIDGCTVTWYTAGTCGKKPGDRAYGITASGLPVNENLTCATDPSVIPMYSDVFVEFQDGTIEQFWATDTGVRGNHVDIYIDDYNQAIQNGKQKLTVWWVPPIDAE